MRRIGVVGLVVLVCASSVVALGAASASGQAEPATFGYTVQIIPPEGAPDAAPEGVTPDGGLELSFGDEVVPAQSEDECRLATIEFTTGAVTPLSAAASPEACAGDLAFAPDGTLYGLLAGVDLSTSEPFPELVRFDTTTGAAEVVGNIGTATQMLGGQGIIPFGGLTFDGAGRLLVLLVALDEDGADPACRVAEATPTCLYRIDDPNNPGVATYLGQSEIIPSGEPGVVGSTLFATCDAVYSTPALTEPITDDANLVVGTELATVDPADGSRTALGAYPDDILSYGADADPADGFWGIGLDYPVTEAFSQHVVAIEPSGGTPAAANGAPIVRAEDEGPVQGLAIAPLDCTPEPVVLQPTFTG